MKNRNKKNTGFTIIEIMVAISLFIVIIMAGMGALLNANLLHNKSSDMRSILDNLSFIMEDMSRNLRTGYNYRCYTIDTIGDLTSNISVPLNCNGGVGIAFEQQNGKLYDPPTSTNYYNQDQWVYYIDNGIIFKSTEGATNGSFIQLTSDEVFIDQASSFFSISGAELPGDNLQPFVTIKLVGTITFKNNVVTPFSLQTSVSQRRIDI